MLDPVATNQRLCGSLEVAREMITRSTARYIDDAEPVDGEVLEMLSHVVKLIDRAVHGLEAARYARAV